jgi:hypothetical protein
MRPEAANEARIGALLDTENGVTHMWELAGENKDPVPAPSGSVELIVDHQEVAPES